MRFAFAVDLISRGRALHGARVALRRLEAMNRARLLDVLGDTPHPLLFAEPRQVATQDILLRIRIAA